MATEDVDKVMVGCIEALSGNVKENQRSLGICNVMWMMVERKEKATTEKGRNTRITAVSTFFEPSSWRRLDLWENTEG